MTFKQFCKRFRCSIAKTYQKIGHRYMRNIEVKTYIMYIDVRTMLPVDPKSNNDCLNCISFSAESSEKAKRRAYDFIKNSGSLQLLEEKDNNRLRA